MDVIFAILDFLTHPSWPGDRSRRNDSWSVLLTNRLLLFMGLLWFVVELRSIINLQSPFLFMAATFIVSAAMAVLLVVGLFFLGLFNSMKRSRFLLIVFALSLLLMSTTSYLNRKNGYWLMPPAIAVQKERSHT